MNEAMIANQVTVASEPAKPEPLFPDGVPPGVEWSNRGVFPTIDFNSRARTLTVKFGCGTKELPVDVVTRQWNRLFSRPVYAALREALTGSDKARQHLSAKRLADEAEAQHSEEERQLATLAKAAEDRWTAEKLGVAKEIAARFLPELVARIQARIAVLKDQDFFAPFREDLEELLILSALADSLRIEEGRVPTCAHFLTPQEVVAPEADAGEDEPAGEAEDDPMPDGAPQDDEPTEASESAPPTAIEPAVHEEAQDGAVSDATEAPPELVPFVCGTNEQAEPTDAPAPYFDLDN